MSSVKMWQVSPFFVLFLSRRSTSSAQSAFDSPRIFYVFNQVSPGVASPDASFRQGCNTFSDHTRLADSLAVTTEGGAVSPILQELSKRCEFEPIVSLCCQQSLNII